MRTLTGGETTVLQSAARRNARTVEVQNGSGTFIDYSAWVLGITLAAGIDQRIATATIHFRRDKAPAATNSLAPLMEGSLLNRDDLAAYSPALDAGRQVRVKVATVAHGATPSGSDYHEVFIGEIDGVDWARSSIEVRATDLAAHLRDRFIEDRSTYGPGPMETVIQDILDDWTAGPVTLWSINGTPATPFAAGDSPGFTINETDFHGISVWSAIERIVQLKGWVIEYRWNDAANGGAGAYVFTAHEPDRSKSIADWTFGPNRYIDVHRLDLDRDGVRNRIRINYPDTSTGRTTVVREDTPSQGRYGVQWMGVREADNSPIDTLTEAQALGDLILADRKDPKAEQEIETLLFWPTELEDLYEFTANGVHYDVNQKWAVVGYRHEIDDNRERTILTVRGNVAGMYTTWDQLEKDDPADEPLTASVSFGPSGTAVVTVNAPPGTADIYITAAEDTDPADPTSTVYDATIAGESGTADTGVVIAAGSVAHVKVRADAGAVRSFRQMRPGDPGGEGGFWLRPESLVWTPVSGGGGFYGDIQVEVGVYGRGGSVRVQWGGVDYYHNLAGTAVEVIRLEDGFGTWKKFTTADDPVGNVTLTLYDLPNGGGVADEAKVIPATDVGTTGMVGARAEDGVNSYEADALTIGTGLVLDLSADRPRVRVASGAFDGVYAKLTGDEFTGPVGWDAGTAAAPGLYAADIGALKDYGIYSVAGATNVVGVALGAGRVAIQFRETGGTVDILLGADLAADGNKITGLPTPSANDEAATKGYVDAQGSATLAGLTDTAITGPATNDLLQWDGFNWVDRTLAEAGVADAVHIHDGRYYTETEVDTFLAAKASLAGAVFTGAVSFPGAGSTVPRFGSTSAPRDAGETGARFVFPGGTADLTMSKQGGHGRIYMAWNAVYDTNDVPPWSAPVASEGSALMFLSNTDPGSSTVGTAGFAVAPGVVTGGDEPQWKVFEINQNGSITWDGNAIWHAGNDDALAKVAGDEFTGPLGWDAGTFGAPGLYAADLGTSYGLWSQAGATNVIGVAMGGGKVPMQWRDTSGVVSTLLGADLDANSNRITGLPTPSAADEAATKGYVDAQGSATLAGLSDTAITGPASNDLLQWDGFNWVDRSYSEAGVAEAIHTHDGRYYTETELTGGGITLDLNRLQFSSQVQDQLQFTASGNDIRWMRKASINTVWAVWDATATQWRAQLTSAGKMAVGGEWASPTGTSLDNLIVRGASNVGIVISTGAGSQAGLCHVDNMGAINSRILFQGSDDIVFQAGGAINRVGISNLAVYSATAGAMDLGTSTLGWGDVFLADALTGSRPLGFAGAGTVKWNITKRGSTYAGAANDLLITYYNGTSWREYLKFDVSAIEILADADLDLLTHGLAIGQGAKVALDDDEDTYIMASADDTMRLRTSGANRMTLTNTTITGHVGVDLLSTLDVAGTLTADGTIVDGSYSNAPYRTIDVSTSAPTNEVRRSGSLWIVRST